MKNLWLIAILLLVSACANGSTSKRTTQVVTATPTATPSLTPTVIPSPTLTPTPTKERLPICLPNGQPPHIEEPLWVWDAWSQAEASGNLPAVGRKVGIQLSFDQQVLFIEWAYEDPLDVALLSYNLADGSVQTIAVLALATSVASPASDCVILFGAVEGEDLEAIIDDLDIPKMIDSQGRRYRFTLDGWQAQSSWSGTRFAWSPDGSQLAFNAGDIVRDRLYLAYVDGSDMRLLFDSGKKQFSILTLAWSPTGEQIAVEAFYDGSEGEILRGIFLVQVDSGEYELAIEDIGASVFWTPSGKAIFYNATFDSCEGLTCCRMLNLETKEVTQVDRTLCHLDPPPETRP